MTQKNKITLKDVENKLEIIKTRLESYKKVEATLTNETLSQTAFFLDLADDSLESGFVNDACDEVDNRIQEEKNRLNYS